MLAGSIQIIDAHHALILLYVLGEYPCRTRSPSWTLPQPDHRHSTRSRPGRLDAGQTE